MDLDKSHIKFCKRKGAGFIMCSNNCENISKAGDITFISRIENERFDNKMTLLMHLSDYGILRNDNEQHFSF